MFKVITVDKRNHGDSPHVAEFSYQAMAEDIKLLMEDMGLKKASFMGHSSGGRAIMYFAIAYVSIYFDNTIMIIYMFAKNNQS